MSEADVQDSICLAPDCASTAKVRGLCRRHYYRWHGAPRAQNYCPLDVQPRVQRMCSVDGCERPYFSSGYCTKHDAHNRRYGTPHRKVPACSTCGSTELRGNSKNELGLYCSESCKQAKSYERTKQAREIRRAETTERLSLAGPIKCGGCKSTYSALSFLGVHGGQTKRCQKCRAKAATYRSKDEIRDQQLRRSYGIGAEDYDRLLDAQGGLCAICRMPETWVRLGNLSRLAVDHCHETGAVRGLLCGNCNQGLGKFKDDVGRLAAAVAYLNNFTT